MPGRSLSSQFERDKGSSEFLRFIITPILLDVPHPLLILRYSADIVLGDRDVEETLRRVAEALAKSDLNALLKPDSELENSLKELVPNNFAATADGDLNDAQFRQEFSDFVEVIKAKENVRKIMGELNRVAPAIYEALVGERDAYMAAGLNGLDEIETIVAVVGIAHVDGIEQNLSANGWKPASMSCPVV